MKREEIEWLAGITDKDKEGREVSIGERMTGYKEAADYGAESKIEIGDRDVDRNGKLGMEESGLACLSPFVVGNKEVLHGFLFMVEGFLDFDPKKVLFYLGIHFA